MRVKPTAAEAGARGVSRAPLDNSSRHANYLRQNGSLRITARQSRRLMKHTRRDGDFGVAASVRDGIA